MKAQTIQIDSLFTSDGEVFPFEPNDTIYGLSISGSVILLSDTSLIRVILTDNAGNEWMVYEAYPMIVEDTSFNIIEDCDETCYLPGVVPYRLKIQIWNSSMIITELNADSLYIEDIDQLRATSLKNRELLKISLINSNLERHDMLWGAGETTLSHLTYQEKKSMFGEKYCLHGYDYYDGGIYAPYHISNSLPVESELVEEFDWRARHGANISGKPYFDGNNDVYTEDCNGHHYEKAETGNGWMTAVKSQLKNNHITDSLCVDTCRGTCYIYCTIGAVEALVNLYFIRTDTGLDLSEQQILSCKSGCVCGGALIGYASAYMTSTGVVDEQNYPWLGADEACKSEWISNGAFQLKVNNYWEYQNVTDIDFIKKAIITNGPLAAAVHYSGGQFNEGFYHAMVLLGFGTIQADDIFHGPYGNLITPDTNDIGKLYWIFKQSYSPSFGDGGYVYHLYDQFYGGNYFDMIDKYRMPIDDITDQIDETRECYDKDSDGYCFWGIGNRSGCENCENCPPDTADEDCDDSNPRIGPYDENYFETLVQPEILVQRGVGILGIPIDNGELVYLKDETLHDITYTFQIKNPGSAQLNLDQSLAGDGIVSREYQFPPNQFQITDYPEPYVCMFDDTTTFKIQLNQGAEPGALAHFHIHLNEPDMDPVFEFTLIINGCETTAGYDSINSQVEWSGSYRAQNRDLHIQRNGLLIVTDTVMLSPDADIIIEPGGKLILDGGKLTRLCNNELWNGIQVWGDSSLSQYPDTNQGYLGIRNGGIIEYAVTGAFVGKIIDGDTLYAGSGGMVEAEDAIFLNNEVDVEFLPFINDLPFGGGELYNFSGFRNCTFKTFDPEFVLPKPIAHVILDGVKGVDFYACTFETEEVPNYPIDENDRGTGILAYDAQVSVKGTCTSAFLPCGSYDSCYFRNLRYGIKAFNTGGNKYFCVSQTVFDSNIAGIYISGYHQPAVVSSRLRTSPGHDLIPGQENAFYGGLYIDGSSGYLVENNYFAGPYNSIPDSGAVVKIGIYVKDSGEDDNEIYNNYFTGLDAGIIAEGINKGDRTGLCLKCNDFRTCLNDMMVTGEGFSGGGRGTGIKENQGTDDTLSYMLAGNTFTPEVQGLQAVDNGGNEKYFWSYFNEAEHFNYFHHRYNQYYVTYPVDITNYSNKTITLHNKNKQYEKNTACPSRSIIPWFKDAEDPRLEKTAADLQLTALKNECASLLDGGNTEALDFDIITSLPDEALELREQLLSDSPYLSDTILKQAIYKETVLPNAMIRDVLTANPQSAKSGEILDAVDDRYDPMPDYMMEEIMQGLNQVGALESLESKIGYWENYRTRAVNKLIREYISDTTLINPEDSLINLIEDETSLESRYRLAFAYWEYNQTEQAQILLTDIPLDFDLSTSEQEIHEKYVDYFEVLQTLKDSNLNIRHLDSSHVQNLITIMDSDLPLISSYARGLLIKGKFINFIESVSFPSQVKSYPAYYYLNPGKAKFSEGDYLSIFPNPCGDFVIVYFNTTTENRLGTIVICDIQGKELDRIKLNCLYNQLIVNLSDFPTGIYIVSLIVDNNLISSRKLSKARQ